MRIEARLVRLAARQHARVSLNQCRVLGLTQQAVSKRVAVGRMRREHAGVYILGPDPGTLDGARMGAVMACGPSAALSHASALLAFGLLDGADRAPFHVSSATARGRVVRGIEAHATRLDPRDVTKRNGVPITTPARALLDAAPSLSTTTLQLAVDRAAQRGQHAQIAALVARSPGHRGLRPLRAALRQTFADAERTKQDFELRLRRLLADAMLAQPLSNVEIVGYEVDLVWPDRCLVVEADGFGPHGRHERERFEDDRRRTADLIAAGYTVLRFTWRQLTEDPAWVLGHVRRALGG